MEPPVIVIDGEEITAVEPTVKLWRKILKYDETATEKTDNQALTEAEEIISEAFKNSKVTPESIEDNVKASQILPLFWSVKTWVMALVFGKVEELPNAQTPTAKE